jgi:WD40 repeat protein
VAWDGNTWTEHVIHHDARVNSVAISADGKTVVIGTFDSVVMIVTRKDNTWTEPQTIHDTHEEEEDDDEDDDDEDDDDDVAIDSIELVAISADGNTVVTGSDWDTTKILAWDGRQWAEHVIYDGGENANASVAISADGNTVVTGSWDTTVKIVTRNADTWTKQYIRSYSFSVLSVAISADGNTVTIGLLDGSAKILTRKDNTWTEQGTIHHNNEVDSIAISADGNTVVIGSKTANIVKWDGIMWRPQHVIHHDGSITSVAISADGALVVTGSEDKTAEISLCLPHSLPGISDFNTRLFEHLLWWAKGSEQKIAKTGWAKNTLDHIRWHAVNFVDKKILQTWIRETMEKVSNRNNQGAPQVSGRKHALGQAGEGSTKRTKQSED